MAIFDGVFTEGVPVGDIGPSTPATPTVGASAQLAEAICLWTIRFPSDDPIIEVTTGASANEALTLSVSALTNYWMAGDDDATPGLEDLVKLFEDALNTNTGGGTYTVTVDTADGTLDISCDTTFEIHWAAGATTVDPTVFGFTAVDTGSVTSVTSPNQTQGIWDPRKVGGRIRPVFRRLEINPVTVGALSTAISGAKRGYALSRTLGEDRIRWTLINVEKILADSAVATTPFGTLEHMWVNGFVRTGRPFRFYPDKTVRTTTSYDLFSIRDQGRPWEQEDQRRLITYFVDLRVDEVSV